MLTYTSVPTSDITSEEDITLLVKAFQDKGRLKALLPTSSDQELDKNERLMFSFWRSVLLGSMPYLQHPLSRYAFLHLPSKHIGQWIHLFYEALEENFKGHKAEVAKARASILARLTDLHFHLPT